MTNRMELFHKVDDAQVILQSNGVFRQTDLFRRGQELFAQYGGGFVRLSARGGTSAPKISWVDLDVMDGVHRTGGQYNAPKWDPEK